jgi:ribosomal protein S27AE
MEQKEILVARLLPKEKWSTCPRCGEEVPEFEFSPQFQLKILDLVTKGLRVETTMELRRVSGCGLKTAKAWVIHKTYKVPFTEQSVCPHCGKPLRTPKAKQCRFCMREFDRPALATDFTSPQSMFIGLTAFPGDEKRHRASNQQRVRTDIHRNFRVLSF